MAAMTAGMMCKVKETSQMGPGIEQSQVQHSAVCLGP